MRTRFILFGGIPILGAATTLLSPLLPTLISMWHWSDAEAGRLFLTSFLSSVAASLLLGKLQLLATARPILVVTCLIFAVGVALLPASPTVALAAGVLCGIGIGIIIPLFNLWIAQSLAHARHDALTHLNLGFGLGAVASPLIAGFVLPRYGAFGLCLPLAGLLVLLAGASLFLPPALPTPPMAGTKRSWRLEGYAAACTFLYSGSETAMYGWLPKLAEELGEARPPLKASLFWGAVLAGRIVGPVLARHYRRTSLTTVGILVGVVSIATLGLFPQLAITPAAIATGLGFALLFPMLIASYEEAAGPSAAQRIGWVFAAASLGAAVIPSIVGAISTNLKSLSGALLVLSVPLLILLFLARRPFPSDQA